MDKPTIRILDTIASNIGDSPSIYQLTERIKDAYGSAYYANIYQKLQALKDEGLLNIERKGRTSSINLNFKNYLLVDTLAEIDIEKKIDFLSTKTDLCLFFEEMDKTLFDKCSIKSISSINPSKTIKRNALEFLFSIRETSNYIEETIEICKRMLELQKKHNIKIDNLILDKKDFFELLTCDEINPLREFLCKKITLFGPQAYWTEIKDINEKNRIQAICTETKPLKISELDLTYNLNRFGYKEFGSHFSAGNKICIEYITTSLLLRGDARGLEAIAIILAKNSFHSNLLAFLSQKYQTASRLMGILMILGQIKAKPEIEDTLSILRALNQKETPADRESITQKLELYNVL